jgi:hypothetical protein
MTLVTYDENRTIVNNPRFSLGTAVNNTSALTFYEGEWTCPTDATISYAQIACLLSTNTTCANTEVAYYDDVCLEEYNGGIQNSSGNVSIDKTGITITNGALTINDEWDETVAGASGFSGGWAKFLDLGIYNGDLSLGAVSALSNGRLVALPYWTISRTGSPTLTRATDASIGSGFRVRAAFSATTDRMSLASDAVPVTGGSPYCLTVVFRKHVATAVQLDWTASYYSGAINGVPSGFISGESGTFAGTASDLVWREPVFLTAAPASGFAVIKLTALESVSHSASNYIDIGMVALQSSMGGLDSQGYHSVDYLHVDLDLSAGSTSIGRYFTVSSEGNVSYGGSMALSQPNVYGTLGTSQNDFDFTGGQSVPAVMITPTAAISITGLLAGIDGQVLLLTNDSTNSAYTITLVYESGSSAVLNRIRCPGAANLVLRAQGSVWLYYFGSRWRVIAP